MSALGRVLMLSGNGVLPTPEEVVAAVREYQAIVQAAKTADVQWEYTGTSNVEWGAWRKAMGTLQSIAKEAP